MSGTNPQIQEAQKTSRFNAKKPKKQKPINKTKQKNTTEEQQKELHLNSSQNSPRQ